MSISLLAVVIWGAAVLTALALAVWRAIQARRRREPTWWPEFEAQFWAYVERPPDRDAHRHRHRRPERSSHPDEP